MDKRIYLDSVVILSYLSPNRDPGNLSALETTLIDATEGRAGITLMPSALAIAEAAYIEGLDDAENGDEDIINEFWRSAPILILEINAVNAAFARQLIRVRRSSTTSGEKPRGRKRAADALHLATAIHASATEFWTYDIEDFEKYRAPDIRICTPNSDRLRLPGC